MGILQKLLKIALVAVLCVVALNAIAYGSMFVMDAKAGLGEFGFDTSRDIEDAARILVGFVGVGLLGYAAFSILSAWLVIRGSRKGLSVALVLGGTYLLFAAFAIYKRIWVDAIIYGTFGAAVTLLAGLLWRLMARSNREE